MGGNDILNAAAKLSLTLLIISGTIATIDDSHGSELILAILSVPFNIWATVQFVWRKRDLF